MIKRCADFGNNVYTRILMERDDGCYVTETLLTCWVLIVQTKRTLHAEVTENKTNVEELYLLGYNAV